MSFLVRHEHSDHEIQLPKLPMVGGENSVTVVPKASSSVIKFYPDWCCGCVANGTPLNTPLEPDASFSDRIAFWFQCPPFGPVARIITFLVIFFLTWTNLYFMIGDVASFHGPVSTLVVLEIFGLFLGVLIKCVGLPALLAPLAFGILLRNVPALDIFKEFEYPFTDEYCKNNLQLDLSLPNGTKCCNELKLNATSNWIGPLRQIALALILTRAGLELSPKKLLKLKLVVPLLAFGPCMIEALTVSGLFYAFFNELEPSIFILFVSGFALSAVSPAVVVPGVMSLSAHGYGIAKGIPTLLVAASSIDDVLAITCFTIFLKLGIQGGSADAGACANHIYDIYQIHKHGSEPLWLATGGPVIGIVIGIVHGLGIGAFFHFFPSIDSKSKGIVRLCVLTLANFAAVFGYGRTAFETGGSIGVLVTSFVAGFGWRSQAHWKPAFHNVEHTLKHIWTLYVPLLFGTIGKEIKFTPEKPDPYEIPGPYEGKNKNFYDNFWNPFGGLNIAKIIGIILIALIVRMLVVLGISRFVAKFNIKECLFMSLAWIPKATVQAALAPLVLTEVLKNKHTVQMMCLAKLIVTMSVMGILITAPLGAVCIALTGPRLLAKATEEETKEIEEEFPNGEASVENIDPSIPSIRDAYSSDVFYNSRDMRKSIASRGSGGRRDTGESITTIHEHRQRGSSLTLIDPSTTEVPNRGSQSLTNIQNEGSKGEIPKKVDLPK